ncbi:alpha/beta hydrolase [Roseomonas marmotae]|uniref:Alpha/beta hydrolase n=1 Tax=Roseomonas marmotae TaxID=2768161 RepID=A0ABS3KCG1_9PROT|nr:alpha/beta hydrolase [Roseomonas marmotae]MBO1075145.1 alpha/beta hydrolase [Roseomonas marmotae]QTI79743.1 alpha/beta hydrolase [Roseomonas marmotae]
MAPYDPPSSPLMPDSPLPRDRSARAAASPALLFLHGAACGEWVWQQGFAGACADAGFAVEALPFLRQTEEGQAAGLGDYVAQTRAAVDALSGPERRPVVLVGHSLGALVAQRLLLEPAIRGAALLSPVPPEGLWFSSTRLALTDPSLWTEAVRMEAPAGQADPALAGSLFGPEMPAGQAQRYLAQMGGESRAALLEAQGPQPVPHGWLHGRPVLVLGAGEDRLIPPDAVHRCALWHGTTAEFMPGMGHLMMLEPGWPRLAARLLDWLRRL